MARLLRRGGTPAVYTYLFAHPGHGGTAYHGIEVNYVFDNVSRFWGEFEHETALAMSSYWEYFASFGDPNGAELPAWGRFTGDNVLRFDPQADGGIHEQVGDREAACDYWDKHRAG